MGGGGVTDEDRRIKSREGQRAGSPEVLGAALDAS